MVQTPYRSASAPAPIIPHNASMIYVSLCVRSRKAPLPKTFGLLVFFVGPEHAATDGRLPELRTCRNRARSSLKGLPARRLGDRVLVGKAHIPREIDPGVLA